MNSGPIAACAHIKSLLLPGLLTLGSIAAALSISLAPPASGPVAAVFPPWWAAARSMLAAANAGSVVRFGTNFVVIVVPDVRHPAAALRGRRRLVRRQPATAGRLRRRETARKSFMKNDLSALRDTVSRVMVPVLWCHVPLAAGIAWLAGNGWLWPGAMAAVIAAVATAAWLRDQAGLATRLTIGVALMGMVSIMVAACAGHPSADRPSHVLFRRIGGAGGLLRPLTSFWPPPRWRPWIISP